MVQRNKSAIYLTVLAMLCGLLIWHAINWYALGKYDEMYGWLDNGKAYLTVLYNLGLMLVIGLLLGFLMVKMVELILNSRKWGK